MKSYSDPCQKAALCAGEDMSRSGRQAEIKQRTLPLLISRNPLPLKNQFTNKIIIIIITT